VGALARALAIEAKGNDKEPDKVTGADVVGKVYANVMWSHVLVDTGLAKLLLPSKLPDARQVVVHSATVSAPDGEPSSLAGRLARVREKEGRRTRCATSVTDSTRIRQFLCCSPRT